MKENYTSKLKRRLTGQLAGLKNAGFKTGISSIETSKEKSRLNSTRIALQNFKSQENRVFTQLPVI